VRDGSVTSTEERSLWLLCAYRCARRVFGLLCGFRAAPDWDPAVGGMNAAERCVTRAARAYRRRFVSIQRAVIEPRDLWILESDRDGSNPPIAGSVSRVMVSLFSRNFSFPACDDAYNSSILHSRYVTRLEISLLDGFARASCASDK